MTPTTGLTIAALLLGVNAVGIVLASHRNAPRAVVCFVISGIIAGCMVSHYVRALP